MKNTVIHEFEIKDLLTIARTSFSPWTRVLMPINVEFYVRTEAGINSGNMTVDQKSVYVVHRDNIWLAKPFIKFFVEKKKNKINLVIKGGVDKEAIHLFTINPGTPNFIIKIN